MLNPEKQFFQKHTLREEPLNRAEQEVDFQLVRQHNLEKPKIEDFKDIYSESKIQKDKERVKRIKDQFQYQKQQRAEILEAILTNQIDQAEWFGPCYAIPTSEYDDIINGVDLVLEFEKNNKVFHLAVDVTTSEDKNILNRKKQNITDKINKGKLAQLEYFQSEADPQLKGILKVIPKVIIGTDQEGVKELSQLMQQMINKKPGGKKELGNCHLQLEFLEQAKAQLELFIDYAKEGIEQKEKPNISIIKKQEQVLEIINRVLENKKGSMQAHRARSQTHQILTEKR